MKIKITVIFIILTGALNAFAQGTLKRVLFLGNSYTYTNNLPQMIANMASSVGDTLIFDQNTPGGYYLYEHWNDSNSTNKIKIGNWDDVVLQDQSLAPALPNDLFFGNLMPYTYKLDSLINHYNDCVETVFYRTWGRKNGEITYCSVYTPYPWPYFCSYASMDSVLKVRYQVMADSNNAIVSPVGSVWNYIRKNNPNIELYQIDESHPSLLGTYAAACTFYAIIFRKNPLNISYNAGLTTVESDVIKNAAKLVAFDSLLAWNVGKYDSIMNLNCTSLNNNQFSSKIKTWQIFPNPSSERISVSNAVIDSTSYLQIYNVLGKVVKTIDKASFLNIDITDLTQGIYYLKINNNQATVLKFIKS